MINLNKNLSDLNNSSARISFTTGGELISKEIKNKEYLTTPNGKNFLRSTTQILNWNKSQLQYNCSLGSVSQSKKFNFSFLNYCKELNITPNKATPIQILQYNLSQICKDLKADSFNVELV